MTPFNPFLMAAGYRHKVQAPVQSSPPPTTPTISSRRRVDLDLRKYHNVSPASQKPSAEHGLSKHADAHCLGDQSTQILSENCICRVPVQPPLTPPQDKEAIDWLDHLSEPVTKCSDGERSVSVALSAERSAPLSSTSERNELSIPGLPQDLSSRENSSPSLWLMGAIRIATQTLNNQLPLSSTKVISHVLPSCGLDQRRFKTYELVCEHLQTILSEPRYISIYHVFALPDGQGVQDIPRSPPATPSFRGGDGYFDAQTMFTHVAQVPLYHEFKSMAAGVRTSQLLQQKNIMPPEANLVVLERYIPPTTAAEIADFFDADSCRSYMADRLPELAVETGSLVLIYPTAKGAKTFARNYIGPVLDPLLRQMVVLRGLGTDAAERLGSMKAISAMMSFEDMSSKVLKLCSALNARSDIQNSRSAFTLSHSETANVVLAKQAWMTWYIDQEQQRLKQDLMEYHKEGGRLPQVESGNTELTAGMLAREIITELQKSATTRQTEAIEVGVFVIRRMQTRFPQPRTSY